MVVVLVVVVVMVVMVVVGVAVGSRVVAAKSSLAVMLVIAAVL